MGGAIGAIEYMKGRLVDSNADRLNKIQIRGGSGVDLAYFTDSFSQAGIEADASLFENVDQLPGFFMARYEGKPEFDTLLFRVA